MRRFLYLLVALTLLLAACGGADEADSTAATAAAGSETTGASAAQTETTAAETTTAPAEETTTTTTVAETTTTAALAVDESSPLYAALAQTNEMTSGRMEGEMVIVGAEGMPADTEFAITFSGEFDYETGDSSMIMDMSSMMEAAPAEEMPPGFEDLFGEMEIRTIGDTAYMRFGMFAMLGVETEWVSMSAEEADSTAGSFGAAPSDPTDLLGEFGEFGDDVDIEELGSETVRGVNTTHYRMIVDMAEMIAEADAEALEDLESMGPISADGTMPIEFWIGDDGYLYRILMEFAGDADAAAGFGSMRMLWEMFDYGADIVVEAPPADQVTDGEALSGFFTG